MSTLKHAFTDLMDILIVIMILVFGIGAMAYTWFGAYGGSRDFHSFPISANTITRLSFGLYEYDVFMSDGLGSGFDGIGLGAAAYLKYITLWLAFIFGSTIIVNILIAVISDGFEIHKDKQRLRTSSGEPFIVSAFHRLIYVFQSFPCCKKTKILWLKKMRFASCKHAKTLLKCTDALPDGMVFDKQLQIRVFQKFKPEIKPLEEMARGFFSNIKSKEMLKCVIDAIFATAKESKAIESFREHNVYERIWDLYKHTDSVRTQKEEARVEGNHVRKVVKPMEARINAKMEKMEAEMKEMRDEMKEDIKELKALLLKMANN
eukprot:g4389.t1